MCESETVQYLRDLIQEKEFLDKIEGHSIIKNLLEQEISRMQCGGRPPGSETPYVDIYNEKPVRVSTKVLVPVKQHPKGEGSTIAEDSGHDSDVSNSPTPRESNDTSSAPLVSATSKSVNNRSIFDKIFNNHMGGGNQDRKRPGFLTDVYSNGPNSNNGEQICKRYKL